MINRNSQAESAGPRGGGLYKTIKIPTGILRWTKPSGMRVRCCGTEGCLLRAGGQRGGGARQTNKGFQLPRRCGMPLVLIRLVRYGGAFGLDCSLQEITRAIGMRHFRKPRAHQKTRSLPPVYGPQKPGGMVCGCVVTRIHCPIVRLSSARSA